MIVLKYYQYFCFFDSWPKANMLRCVCAVAGDGHSIISAFRIVARSLARARICVLSLINKSRITVLILCVFLLCTCCVCVFCLMCVCVCAYQRTHFRWRLSFIFYNRVPPIVPLWLRVCVCHSTSNQCASAPPFRTQNRAFVQWKTCQKHHVAKPPENLMRKQTTHSHITWRRRVSLI